MSRFISRFHSLAAYWCPVIVVSPIQTPEALERGLKRLESLLAEW